MDRLSHGWRLVQPPGLAEETVREFIRPAVQAVPRSLAVRLPRCQIALLAQLEDPGLASRWTETEDAIEIELALEGFENHDVALELLVCLGQALWERISSVERKEYLQLLSAEIDAGVTGEIDEDALREKHVLFAGSTRRLEAYASASFASTLAEYVHCLWHDVTVREGPEHLPAEWLRQRLETLARWFPPDPGYRLFPQGR